MQQMYTGLYCSVPSYKKWNRRLKEKRQEQKKERVKAFFYNVLSGMAIGVIFILFLGFLFL